MEHLSWTSIGFYSVFGIFVFYQQLHSKNFQGSSEIFGLLLTLFAFAGTVIGIAYLIYYGWTVVWWAPIVIFLIGLVATIPGIILERLVGGLVLSLLGFVIWPVCAYFMFVFMPNAT